MTTRPEHYAVLGVEPDCDFATLKKAYYRLAKANHPDRNGNSPQSEEAFKRIVNAFDVLSDPEKRCAYDCSASRETDAADVLRSAGEHSIMDTPADDALEELITGNHIPDNTSLSRLMLDLAETEVFVTFREGKTLFAMCNFKAARICFLRAAAHSPGNILYRCYLARACARVNDFPGAVREYRQAIRLGEQRTPPQKMRAVRAEFERFRQRQSPLWYRIYMKLFPQPPADGGDVRQDMIESTNRSIAAITADRRRNKNRRLNK